MEKAIKKYKRNKALWNVETSLINEVAFYFYTARIVKVNKRLKKEGQDKRAGYITLDEFLNHPSLLKNYIERSNIHLRKYKIDKIRKCI